MFCMKCGASLADGAAFCMKCGERVAVTDTENEITKTAPDRAVSASGISVRKFIDNRIKNTTSFVSAKDYLAGVKPTRFIWLASGTVALLVTLFTGGNVLVGLFVGVAALALSIMVCEVLHNIDSKQRTPFSDPEGNDIDELTVFLRDNLSELGFTEWQRGVPTAFGIRDDSAEVVQCLFNNETYHRIRFDAKYPGTYRVECCSSKGLSVRNMLKYKNMKKAHPIIRAALEYYYSEN